MILVDANLLLYAKISDLPQHRQARTWLEERLNGPTRVGLPWPSLLAFFRIASNPRVLGKPMSSQDAWAEIERWLSLDNVWVPAPTSRHREVMAEIVKTARPTADLVPDAHLAALAIEHGLTLCSTDGDFGRFESLHWHNPLAGPGPETP